jgi:hypothetical protein
VSRRIARTRHRERGENSPDQGRPPHETAQILLG